jgi:hypothetical protein
MSKRRNPNMPLPYYSWYVDRWLSDRRVQRFSPAAEGIARRLLDHCWKHGYVVNDLEEMAEISRSRLTMFVREWQQIKTIFRSVDGADGQLLTSDFVELERTEQDATRTKRAAAGRLGGVGKANASKCQQMPDSRVVEEKSSNPDQFEIEGFVPSGSPPAPHGAASLAEMARVFARRVQRGEVTRENVS